MNLNLMRLLDEQYTKAPYYGIRRMTAVLLACQHGQRYVARKFLPLLAGER